MPRLRSCAISVLDGRPLAVVVAAVEARVAERRVAAAAQVQVTVPDRPDLMAGAQHRGVQAGVGPEHAQHRDRRVELLDRRGRMARSARRGGNRRSAGRRGRRRARRVCGPAGPRRLYMTAAARRASAAVRAPPAVQAVAAQRRRSATRPSPAPRCEPREPGVRRPPGFRTAGRPLVAVSEPSRRAGSPRPRPSRPRPPAPGVSGRLQLLHGVRADAGDRQLVGDPGRDLADLVEGDGVEQLDRRVGIDLLAP